MAITLVNKHGVQTPPARGDEHEKKAGGREQLVKIHGHVTCSVPDATSVPEPEPVMVLQTPQRNEEVIY